MNYWKSLTKHWKRIHTVILLAVLVVFAAAIVAGTSVSAASGDGTVIYVKDNTGSGTGDGSSYENALPPLTPAATGVDYAQYNTTNQVNTALHTAWKNLRYLQR